MQSIRLSGFSMEGPYAIDADDRIPITSGIYIVITKTEDSKLRGVYIASAGNLREHIHNNPRKDCWKKNEIKELSIWIHSTTSKTAAEREKILFKIREDRQYFMPCTD